MEPLLEKMTRQLSPTRVAVSYVCSIFFNRLGLTLVCSIVVEAVFCLVAILSGFAWLGTVWWCFHYPAYFLLFGWLDPDTGDLWQAFLWFLLMFSTAVFQWCLMILGGRWIFRRFRRKNDRGA